MLLKLKGHVATFKPITKRSVQLQLKSVDRVIELTVSEPWVISRNDYVVVAGEVDSVTGKFIGYAYRNQTKNIFGMYDASGYFGYWFGAFFVIGALLFSWAIFPLFTHLPAGIRSLKTTSAAKTFHRKVIDAANSLQSL